MKKTSIALLAIIFLAACSSEQVVEETMEIGQDIVGVASPIKLQPDTTIVYIQDYVLYADQVDSISFSDDMHYTFDAEHGIVELWSGSKHHLLSTMHLGYKGQQYVVPVLGSDIEKVEFAYEATSLAVADVRIKGSFNGWNANATVLDRDGSSWTTTLNLSPGLYEYLIVEDGVEMLDRTNSNKKDNGMGGENSTFQVGETSDPVHIASLGYDSEQRTCFIDYSSVLADPLIRVENQLLPATYWERRADSLVLRLPKIQSSKARAHLSVVGYGPGGMTNDILIPLADGTPVQSTSQIDRTDKHAYSMYFLMVDRFFNGDTANDHPVDDPEIHPLANYMGGDLTGIDSVLNQGYFDGLNVNTVWLSPIGLNPIGAYGLWDKNGVRSKFSGYHGYWPASSSKVDFRFGTNQELTDLIASVHQSDQNILLDYVANHVHQDHPVYQNHPEWATDLYLPDGSLNTERWDEHRLTTWFDTFLPTLDLRKDEVVEAMTDSALYWFKSFEIDGFRHDATKHIPTKFWRELTYKLKSQVVIPDSRPIFQIGETYGNPKLIDSYIGTGLLDAQFDFNLYDAAVNAFAKEDGDLANLDRVLKEGLSVYGSHHLMGNMSGNQDRTRFISYADGSVDFSEDPKNAGWTRDIEPNGTEGYRKLAMLHAFNFTIPGIPVIYYGDEFGMVGANDPDNRRMMRFGDQLDSTEVELLQTVRKITKLRKELMPLNYGELQRLYLDEHVYAYARTYLGESVLVFFNTGSETTVEIDLDKPHLNSIFASHFGSAFTQEGGKLRIDLEPQSFEILTQ